MEAQHMSDSITKLITLKEKLNHGFFQEMRKLQTSSTDHVQEICNEHEKKLMMLLESEKSLLRDLEKRLALSEESRKLEKVIEKKMGACRGLDHAVLERLKVEREDLSTRIIVLQQRLDAKQKLELEIQQLRGFLEVMKDSVDEDVVEALKKAMIMLLKGKEAELKGL